MAAVRVGLGVLLYVFLVLVAFFGFVFSLFARQDISLSVFTVFVAAGGFLLSLYIWHVKRSGSMLVCPTGSDCNVVIFSHYSRFLGVPLELGGIFYYLTILFFYSLSALLPGVIPQGAVFGVLVATSAAWLFSLYLTAIQAFVLKQWCTWCLLSMIFSSIIFFVSVSSLSVGTAFLATVHSSLLVVHLLAFALGVGGTTVVAVLLFKFLKDWQGSEFEKSVLHTVFQIIWFSLIVLILTEVLLYVAEVGRWASTSFLVKMVVVVVMIAGGMVINFIIMPRLFFMPASDAARLRRAALGLGVVVVVSWYFAFILDTLPVLLRVS